MIDSKDANSVIVDVDKGSLGDFLLGFEDGAVDNSEVDGEQDFGEVDLVPFGFDLDFFPGILWGARLRLRRSSLAGSLACSRHRPGFGRPQP